MRQSAARLSTVIATLLFGTTTTAGAETVTLVNRAQAGIESTVPQSPLSLMVRADCAFARTIEESRGGPSPCPAGTWPGPGGDWSPTVNVAAGDRLEVSFSTAQESVAVIGTSNHPVGLTDPDGKPISNEPLGTFVVTPTADPRIWAAIVPALDFRARFEGFSAIAITAREVDGRARNVAFRLQTPRNVDESTRCGPAFYSASESGYQCPGAGIPPGGGRPPIPTPVVQIPQVAPGSMPPKPSIATKMTYRFDGPVVFVKDSRGYVGALFRLDHVLPRGANKAPSGLATLNGKINQRRLSTVSTRCYASFLNYAPKWGRIGNRYTFKLRLTNGQTLSKSGKLQRATGSYRINESNGLRNDPKVRRHLRC